MRSERGRLRVPDRAIESGRLDGTVLIRMYRPSDGRVVDTDRDPPVIVVEADEALFDSRLGEVRCDKRVKVVTEQLRFEGEGLTMLLTPDGRNIERLTVERPLSPIEITRRVAPQRAADDAADAAGPRGGPRAAGPADPVEARFYRLTLDRAVQVTRMGAGDRTRIEGDRLEAVFSLEGNAIGENLALHSGDTNDALVMAPAGPLGLSLLAGAMAAARTDEERTEIRYAGRLTMELLDAKAERPPTRDDVLIDITGTPTRLEDERSAARIDCGKLRYVTGDEAVSIEAQSGRRFVLASPRLDLEATRFAMNRRTGKGQIDGEGRMRLGGADGAAVQVVAAMPAEAVKGSGERALEAAPASARTVRMEWSRGVALSFEPGAQAARLRQADFRGAVRANADEVRMEAERLVVDCVAKGSRDAVTRLLAEGSARAVRQPDGSSLAAERVDLSLEPMEDGGSRPSRLLAEGRVAAADGVQRLWTDAMECTFRATPGSESAERVDVAEMKSRGAVQALVSGDARIWASALEADPTARKVTLTGPDLLLARGTTAADGMARIEMDELAGVGSAPGPGRCRAFDVVVADASPEPRTRPTLPERASMEATWTEGLKYHRVDAQTSEVQLLGGVNAVASRVPTERDDLQAAQATLTLASAGTGSRTAAGEAGSIKRVAARGDVRLESRAWGKPDRSDEPRLFRLQAQEVIHDVATGESEVPSAGTLLVFDRDDEGARAAPPSLFDGRGSTRFKWAKRLDMKRIDAIGRFRIDLDESVEVIHAGLREQDTLTLTCDRLQATVDRVESGAAADPKARPAGVPADLGTPVQLRRIEGLGRVFVRTNEVDVECDTFDYDLATGIAQVTARPGRMIRVLQRGNRAQPAPVQAESAVWDLQNGRIRIVGASASGLR
jgi:hypothetical protein